jgi:hypothetical protein
MAPGTLSLALKHKLAVAEMLRRGLSAPLVVELTLTPTPNPDPNPDPNPNPNPDPDPDPDPDH